MSELEIYGINGPVITIKGKTDLRMMETVYIGNARLIGEVIGLTEERTTIQCYENTTGVRPGEPVSPHRNGDERDPRPGSSDRNVRRHRQTA